MHFGDKCAATGLEVGKEMTADKGEDVCPETMKQLKRGYVDDELGGGNREMVDRLIGEEKQDKALGTWQYGGTVAQIMKRGNFHVKFMIKNGETRTELLELVGGKVLGIPWDPPQDMLRMQMKVNLSPRKQGIRTGPILNLDTLVMINQVELTRRIMLSQVHGVFDSLGLLSPLTIQYKILIQKIVVLGLEWDEILSGDIMDESRSVLREMVMAVTVEFPRSAVGENWSAGGILAGFWDGGNPASACCVYACSLG